MGGDSEGGKKYTEGDEREGREGTKGRGREPEGGYGEGIGRVWERRKRSGREGEDQGRKPPISMSGTRLSVETRQTGRRDKRKMPGLQLYIDGFSKVVEAEEKGY